MENFIYKFRLFGFTLNSNNFCHSEKTENLAFSVDFRLIQNLSMLIKAEVSLLGWKAQPTVTTIE